jgi:hypothetical protein
VEKKTKKIKKSQMIDFRSKDQYIEGEEDHFNKNKKGIDED